MHLDKGIIFVLSGTEQDGPRVYCATQNSMQFKMYKLFISTFFHIIFSDHVWPQGNETVVSETTDKETLL